jgi:hypothetical protein
VFATPLPFDGSFVVAPDGTKFYNTPTEFTYITGLTEDQVKSRFEGVWTINDFYQVPPAEAPQLHQVTITGLTDSFAPTPTLQSPMEGEIVPRRFEVISNGESLRLYGATQRTFKSLGPGHTEVVIGFPDGVDELPLGIRAINFLTTGRTMATSLSPKPLHQFNARVIHHSYSLERSITVLDVPEPAAYSLLLAGSAAIPVARRRR